MAGLTQSYSCGTSSDPIIYETIGNYLNRVASRHPDTEALVVCHQKVRWTYSEFNEKVDELARGLLKIGIDTGDRVGIWGPNSYEWVLTQMATAGSSPPVWSSRPSPSCSAPRRPHLLGSSSPAFCRASVGP